MRPDRDDAPGAGSAGPGDADARMDVRAAAELLRRTAHDTRAALTVRSAPINAAWGVAWLVGLGVMWLVVRAPRPYRGPTAPTAILLAALILAAAALAARRDRA